MKATAFAKKLRAQLAKRKAARTAAMKKFAADFHLWKLAFTAWLRANGPARVQAIKPDDGTSYRRHPFDVEAFFKGAPERPKDPEFKDIRAIQTELRRLGITGQETVRVSDNDMAKLFVGDDDKGDD